MNTNQLKKLFLLLSLIIFAIPAQSANKDQAIGIGINEIRNWMSSVPFVDLFKSAKPFPATAGVTFDAQGWPEGLPDGTSISSIIIDPVISPVLPDGNYIVRYLGEGVLSYEGSFFVTESTTGRDVLSSTPLASNKYLKLNILQSNPQNPIRNIQITLPGGICTSDTLTRVESANACNGDYQSFEDHASSILFNPDFLNFVKDFRVLRYMDFMATNGSTVEQWDDRTRMEDAMWWSESGAPVEVMVELANRANANPWFNMPHLADDNYVREFARYVRDHLDPGLKAYIEYTNEAWSGNVQGNYIKNQGLALNLDTDDYLAQIKYYSKRSVEIFNLWENEFNGLDRLVRVLAGQLNNAHRSNIILSYNNSFEYTDLFALNPYISGNTETLSNATTLDDVFAEMYNPDSLNTIPHVHSQLLIQSNVAQQYGVRMVTYEGGQHLVDYDAVNNDEPLTQLLNAANRDPRMADLYQDILANWKDAGGQLFMFYTAPRIYNKDGSWGVSEYINQPRSTAPKYDAILSFMETTPCWWDDCSNDTELDVYIDFQSETPGDYSSLSISGFDFAPVRSNRFKIVQVGTNISIQPIWNDAIKFTLTDNSAFDLDEFDYIRRWNGTVVDLTITGTRLDGSVLTETILDISSDQWSSKTLNWTDLQEVVLKVDNGTLLIDNLKLVQTSTDPEPATTIDFESVNSGNYTPLTTDGYDFSPIYNNHVKVVTVSDNQVLQPLWGDTMSMSRTDNQPFSLENFKYKARWPGVSGIIEITGTQVDGSLITDVVPYINTDPWKTMTLNWHDLESVKFRLPNGTAVLDDIIEMPSQ